MPNKYSHALVLNLHETRGLIDYGRSATPKLSPATSSSTNPHPSRSNPTNERVVLEPSPPPTRDRVRLEEPLSPHTTPYNHPLRRKCSSADTTISTPLPFSSPPQKQDRFNGSSIRRQSHATQSQRLSRSIPQPSSNFAHSRIHNPTSTFSTTPKFKPEPQNYQHLERQGLSAQRSFSPEPFMERSRSVSNASQQTEIWAPQSPSAPSPAPKPSYNSIYEQYSYAPQRPPSPPLTPEQRHSYLLDTNLDPSRPPIPEKNVRRSPPGSTSSVSPIMDLQEQPYFPEPHSSPSRPGTIPNCSQRPRALSISTRTSSLNATHSSSKMHSMTSSDPSKTFSTTSTTPSKAFSITSSPTLDFDTDLSPLSFDLPTEPFELPATSLPTELPANLDYTVLPWEQPHAGPAIFRGESYTGCTPYHRSSQGQEQEQEQERDSLFLPPSSLGPSTRDSSFDSAVPPPIGRHRPPPPSAKDKLLPKTPRKEKSTRRTSFSFLRPTTPKAIPYLQTELGRPPIPVSENRTALSSIPNLFPGYKGTWPPLEKQAHVTMPEQEKPVQNKRRNMMFGVRRQSWFRGG